jgi:catechol 2,3-dioxygenase-like lactoylglutathione lyase family enzyme
MLKDSKVATRIPVQDLQRAKKFYAEKLGLEPREERPGGLLYRHASGEFAFSREYANERRLRERGVIG